MWFDYIQRVKDWLRGYPLLGAPRSSQWGAVRRIHLELHPTCAVCGKKGTFLSPLNVHHIVPFHNDPTLELSQSNFITLCPRDHLIFGHLGSWKSYNSEVAKDSEIWYSKIVNRP